MQLFTEAPGRFSRQGLDLLRKILDGRFDIFMRFYQRYLVTATFVLPLHDRFDVRTDVSGFEPLPQRAMQRFDRIVIEMTPRMADGYMLTSVTA